MTLRSMASSSVRYSLMETGSLWLFSLRKKSMSTPHYAAGRPALCSRAMADANAARPGALVVEDDEQVAQLIRFVLEQEGYEVLIAGDIRTGRALLKGMPPAALATLDITLPDGSGVDLLLALKDLPGWARVPVIMVTARPKDANVSWA